MSARDREVTRQDLTNDQLRQIIAIVEERLDPHDHKLVRQLRKLRQELYSRSPVSPVMSNPFCEPPLPDAARALSKLSNDQIGNLIALHEHTADVNEQKIVTFLRRELYSLSLIHI